ncbi:MULTISPECIES: prepilin-type N-terminal cleavage/methylation domain-containing protein [unclassified Thiocapsa]|uniref:type IV pilus modification PilV family protein n=1 Tax=unclassified Thiocapsa TaxID=2641286 RepID=UPI0035AF3425
MSKRRHHLSRQIGFTLVEILVTAVILAFGLLGLAGLQAKMTVTQMEAYQRAHALVLVEDMVARINSQRDGAKSGSYVSSGGMTRVGTGTTWSWFDCSLYYWISVPLVDLCEWDRALKGADTVEDGRSLGGLIGARGCIEWLSDPDEPLTLRVSVAWQGLAETQAPSLPCGRDAFDTESKRRVLTTELILADLEQ